MRRRSQPLLPCLLLLSITSMSPTLAAERLPPLTETILAGDFATAVKLLSSIADVNEASNDGTTALHWAVQQAPISLVRALLGAGARPDIANRYGITALQLAAERGDAAILEALLAEGADPNIALPSGETVLMTAARTGDAATLTALLDAGADPAATEQWHGETALIWAAANHHANAVNLLLSRGADPDQRSASRVYERRRLGQSILPLGEWTPLMYAARENALAAGLELMAAGARIDLRDPDGATALVIAIINAHYEFAAALLEHGADPNIADEGGLAALYAAVDMHRLAIGHGRPNPRPAGRVRAIDMIALLLEHSADPNAVLNRAMLQRHHTIGDLTLGEGATPLLRAAKSGAADAARLLVAAGASITHTMPNGANALMYAAGLGWRNGSPLAPSYDQGTEEEAVATIAFLLAQGLTVNGQDNDGNTALHHAVTGRGSATIIRYLLTEAGADPGLQNAAGANVRAAAEALRNGEAVVSVLDALGVGQDSGRQDGTPIGTE